MGERHTHGPQPATHSMVGTSKWETYEGTNPVTTNPLPDYAQPRFHKQHSTVGAIYGPKPDREIECLFHEICDTCSWVAIGNSIMRLKYINRGCLQHAKFIHSPIKSLQ
jgi:hypothetical protein